MSKFIRKEKLLVFNIASTIIQVIASGLLLFVLYRYILAALGRDLLGLWALTLSVTSIGQVASIGITGGIVKFVAKYSAQGNRKKVALLVQTAALATIVCFGVILILLYPVIKFLLSLVVSPDLLSTAYLILPYAVVSLWITMISGIYQSALDGCQRIYVRTAIVTVCSFLHLVFSIALIPVFHLLGLAYAQIIQNGIALIASIVMARRYFPELPIFPHRWSTPILKEILPYGVGFQMISVSQLLYDPITKGLLSRFGGLGMVAYYEMASKMILQVRSLLISANLVIVPSVAHIQEHDEEQVSSIYREAYTILFFFSVPTFAMFIALLPAISEVWIGKYSKEFVFFSVILSGAWFINILAGPAYYCNLGTGKLKWNVISHVGISIINGILGYIFGNLFGSSGVIIAWALALSAGSIVITVAFNKERQIPLSFFVPRSLRILVPIYGMSSVGGLVLYYLFRDNLGLKLISGVQFFSIALVITVCMASHPLLRSLWANILINLSRK